VDGIHRLAIGSPLGELGAISRRFLADGGAPGILHRPAQSERVEEVLPPCYNANEKGFCLIRDSIDKPRGERSR